ncbi:hypothetical protein OG618_00180 [Kitasatospora sp. NBC_01246]|uniref:hypothetical protein n=1 Tax=Kitasatospora sp. NBC_01246 TaxID=2903570 RepID=UPI002E341E9C|nr:hypothetical protein [Kitasatospora sp. NBC_01246]
MGGPRLAAKLNAYARYWATAPLPAGMRAGTIEAVQGGRKPLWERRYPVFPRLLFVLTGTGQTGFANRATDLETAARTPYVARMLRTVAAGVAKPEDLEADGPGADNWWPLSDLDDGPPWWELTGTKP